jgi:Flp pilus assembly protein TadD
MAFLDRAHRTPGLSLTLDGPHGPWTATVALLPIYAAPDARGRVQALYDLAIRAYADGDADGAMVRLEAALCLDPTFGDAYEAIGVILGKAGRYHEAIDFFRRLEEVAPDEPMVNTNLSLYFMKIGDKQTAEDEGGKATLKGMARTRGKGAAQMDQEMEEGRRKDAVRKRDMFRRVLQIDEADAIALFGLGSACLVLGEAAEAAKHLGRAVEVDKNNSAVYVPLGKALEQLERVDEAVAAYRAGMEVASRKGDLMPLKEMEHRLLLLGKSRVA